MSERTEAKNGMTVMFLVRLGMVAFARMDEGRLINRGLRLWRRR